jgi:uncharacterized protein (DUF1501 family)
MQFNRRQFLKGASATALVAGTHVLLSGARSARAAGPSDPILVLVNLRGGNDALNTVIPLDNVGAPQRSLYDSMRPDLGIQTSLLGGMEIGADPQLGTALALHPALADLKTLYDESKLAIVNGVGIANSSLSHFEAEDVWYSGNPTGLQDTGWVGRHLDASFNDEETRAISFGSIVNSTLASLWNDALGVNAVDRFDLPDDPYWEFRDLASRLPSWTSIYADDRGGAGLAARIARSGARVVETSQIFGQIETRGWGSFNEGGGGSLSNDLRDVASILRHDLLNPGASTGLCFFHCRMGGYDTHSRQGTTDLASGHPRLMDQLSRGLHGFQRDLETLGLAHRVVTVVYSEFGRRAHQNDSGGNAGTDHGRAGSLFVLGDPVIGGLYGQVPELDALDAGSNLVVNTDFRRVYAALIDDWLGGDHTAVLPGAPFVPLPVIA